jgi:8-oxo-dGTP diphosphatase
VTYTLQRITNCILLDRENQKVLLLKKPRRGWWVAPGGKMEALETVTESVSREYKEETGLTIINPQVRGIFTIVVENNGEVIDEWMMYTFFTDQYKGQLVDESPEGDLEWIDVEQIRTLPKAKGDQVYFDHILNNNEVLVKRFRYTPEYELIACE